MSELDILLQEYDAALSTSVSIPWNEYHVVSFLRDRGDEQVLLVADAEGTLFILKTASGTRGMALEREYQALRRLEYPCFPRALAFEQIEGRAWFQREYIPGKTLETYAGERPLSVEESLSFGREVCDILSVLHGLTPPIIHRDIKPQNFIVTPEARLVLVDFDSVQDHDPQKEQDTLFIGTPETAAPEQFGAGRSGFATDVFGIGKLLLYLITSDTDLERLNGASAPLWLKRVIRRATAFDPKRRYPSVKNLRNALLRGRRRPLKIVTACLALAILCCGSAVAIPAMIRQREAMAPVDENAPVRFKEPLIEKAAAYSLGKEPGTITRGDLRSMTKLLICGDTPYDQWDQADSFGKDNTFIYDLEPTGTLPKNDGNIVSLEDLRLMPNLRELALYRQQISDISVLSELPLKRLALAENPIRDFSVLASLEQLTHLNVSATNFRDASVLTGCPNLESLRIMETLVIDLSPVENLPIREFYLYHENVADDMSILLRFPELSHLKIHLVPAAELEMIGSLKNLEHLDIDRYKGKTLESIINLTNLRYLFFCNSSVSSLEGIQNLQRLEYIGANGCPIRDLSPLYELKNLRFLRIGGVVLDDETQLTRLEQLDRIDVSPGQVKRLQDMDLPFEVHAAS